MPVHHIAGVSVLALLLIALAVASAIVIWSVLGFIVGAAAAARPSRGSQ